MGWVGNHSSRSFSRTSRNRLSVRLGAYPAVPTLSFLCSPVCTSQGFDALSSVRNSSRFRSPFPQSEERVAGSRRKRAEALSCCLPRRRRCVVQKSANGVHLAAEWNKRDSERTAYRTKRHVKRFPCAPEAQWGRASRRRCWLFTFLFCCFVCRGALCGACGFPHIYESVSRSLSSFPSVASSLANGAGASTRLRMCRLPLRSSARN